MSGLSSAPTQDLKTLSRALQRKTIQFPITAARLRAAGVGRLVEHLPRLADLTPEQAASLVECVLAERTRRGGPALELVWTGPDVPETLVRDTGIVVRDLFASAQASVLIGGCYFSGGEAILEPLYRGIKERGVQATVCLNLHEPARSEADVPGHVRQQVRAFIAKNWPFGEPLPRFYYDPRTVAPVPPGRSRILLHSKCVVVDERTAFITSANFTHNGQARNIETGVLIEDEKFAGELAGHWHTMCPFQPSRVATGGPTWPGSTPAWSVVGHPGVHPKAPRRMIPTTPRSVTSDHRGCALAAQTTAIPA